MSSLESDAAHGTDYADALAEVRRADQTLQRQLARARAKVDDLVDATIESARAATLSLGPIERVPAPDIAGDRATAEVALWDTGSMRS